MAYRRALNSNVRSLPAGQLLVYSADQGWKPLCEFPGVPEPLSGFPNVNDRAAIKQTIRGITRRAYFIPGFAALAFSGLAYGLVRVFS